MARSQEGIGMTIGELRAILESDWIDDDIVPYDYEDNVIRDVTLVIGKDGRIGEIRFGMQKP